MHDFSRLLLSSGAFASLLGSFGLLLFFNLLDVGLDFIRVHHPHGLTTLHHRNFEVLSAKLDDLEQGFGGQLDGGVLGVESSLGGEIFLEEFTHGLGIAANGVRLPFGVNAGRVSLVKVRSAVVVESGDETRNAEWTPPSELCVPLFHASDMLGDVLEAGRVLYRETMRLTLLKIKTNGSHSQFLVFRLDGCVCLHLPLGLF